jgi:hypothetical protein
MKYQVSLEGKIKGMHVQLKFYDARNYWAAMREARTREHLPHDAAEEYIALLFSDRQQAILDGIPRCKIERIRGGENPLYRYRIN